MIITLSTETVESSFLVPLRNTSYRDFSLGDALSIDDRTGSYSYLWQADYDQQTGEITLYRTDEPSESYVVHTVLSARYIGFTFDQNMRHILCYAVGETSYLYWYDSVLGAYTITVIPNAVTPCVSLDDVRNMMTATSDVIVGYISDDKLCVRYQRDRYLIEHVLKELYPNARLRQMGMTTQYRFQFLVM